MPISPNPTDDALTFQANQADADTSPDVDSEDPEDRAPNSRPQHHQHEASRFDYPRPTERPPVAAPRRAALRLPETPKSLNGKRITRSTLPRDRALLESKKQRG